MLKSIATVSLSGTLVEKLEAAAAARFDAVEIFENDLISFPGTPAEVRRIANDLGLAISLYQPFRDFEAAPRDRFQHNLARAEHKFDVMEQLGATTMLVCSSVAVDTLADDALAAADFHALAERAACRGMRIGYEALAWGRQVNRYEHAWRIVQQAAHPSLGLVLDSFHTLAVADDLSGLARIPEDRIFIVQIADAPRMHLDVLSWSRHYRCFPGQGQLDVAGFLAPIVANGYAGPISLEIFNDDFRSASTRQSAADGMRSLQLLEELTAVRLGAFDRLSTEPSRGAVTDESARVDLFRAPSPPVFSGIDFLEFAVDATSETKLAALLVGLGFERIGRHRSKTVSLYRQGEINLILNREPNSFARSFFLTHGPSICAIALATNGVARGINRARLYHCATFESRIGAGERSIPAFRQPDGGLIYLVQAEPGVPSIYEFDFVLEHELDPQGSPGMLHRIDHVSIALPPGQLDTWLLFYKAVFGFEADDAWFLPDPYGFVRSRAVKNAAGTIRIPLSIASSRGGASAHAISAYSGAGVQHIALESNDIFATAERLKRAGVALLEIPANYYDDLVARHDLSDDFAAALRRCNILYDRSNDGEFLQLYSATFEDRFFFEIVERRGYKEYGAINAPVRMAAQTQSALTPAVEAWAESL